MAPKPLTLATRIDAEFALNRKQARSYVFLAEMDQVVLGRRCGRWSSRITPSYAKTARNSARRSQSVSRGSTSCFASSSNRSGTRKPGHGLGWSTRFRLVHARDSRIIQCKCVGDDRSNVP